MQRKVDASAHSGNRLMALEGLRGLAAIIVVLYHALLMFYFMMFSGPGENLTQNSFIEDNVYGVPLAFLISGTFAVAIFFVLSGFVLSVGFLQTGKTEIIRKLAAKRYIRLMVPALVSILIAWFLISSGASFTQSAVAITHSVWLGHMWNITPNFFDALQQGIWGIFVSGSNYYNPVLWTMYYEFLGSFMVFAIMLLFGKLKNRWIIYIVMVIATFQSWFLGFILGVILADLYVNRQRWFKASHPVFFVGAFALGIIMAGFPGGSTVNSVYQTIQIPFLAESVNRSLFITIGAALIMVAILGLPSLSNLLSRPRISRLGTYTFSVYLTHKLVLFSFCAWIFTVFVNQFQMPFNIAVICSLALSAPVIIIAAYLFERYVDAPSIRASGVFANWLLGLPQKEGITAYSDKKIVNRSGIKALATRMLGRRTSWGVIIKTANEKRKK